MKRIVLCIIGICSFAFLSAQNLVEEDSLRVPATSNFSKRLDRFFPALPNDVYRCAVSGWWLDREK